MRIITGVELFLDALKVTGNDFRLRAFYPCRILVPPATETSCYIDLVSLLQQVQIPAVTSLPGGHDVPGRFYDRAAVATLVAIIGRNAHRCMAFLSHVLYADYSEDSPEFDSV